METSTKYINIIEVDCDNERETGEIIPYKMSELEEHLLKNSKVQQQKIQELEAEICTLKSHCKKKDSSFQKYKETKKNEDEAINRKFQLVTHSLTEEISKIKEENCNLRIGITNDLKKKLELKLREEEEKNKELQDKFKELYENIKNHKDLETELKIVQMQLVKCNFSLREQQNENECLRKIIRSSKDKDAILSLNLKAAKELVNTAIVVKIEKFEPVVSEYKNPPTVQTPEELLRALYENQMQLLQNQYNERQLQIMNAYNLKEKRKSFAHNSLIEALIKFYEHKLSQVREKDDGQVVVEEATNTGKKKRKCEELSESTNAESRMSESVVMEHVERVRKQIVQENMVPQDEPKKSYESHVLDGIPQRAFGYNSFLKQIDSFFPGPWSLGYFWRIYVGEILPKDDGTLYKRKFIIGITQEPNAAETLRVNERTCFQVVDPVGYLEQMNTSGSFVIACWLRHILRMGWKINYTNIKVTQFHIHTRGAAMQAKEFLRTLLKAICLFETPEATQLVLQSPEILEALMAFVNEHRFLEILQEHEQAYALQQQAREVIVE